MINREQGKKEKRTVNFFLQNVCQAFKQTVKYWTGGNKKTEERRLSQPSTAKSTTVNKKAGSLPRKKGATSAEGVVKVMMFAPELRHRVNSGAKTAKRGRESRKHTVCQRDRQMMGREKKCLPNVKLRIEMTLAGNTMKKFSQLSNNLVC